MSDEKKLNGELKEGAVVQSDHEAGASAPAGGDPRNVGGG